MKTNDEIVQGIGGALSGFGGFLRCEVCGRERSLGEADVSRYLGSGWPRHCGYTMRWWTARQIAANEVPEFRA